MKPALLLLPVERGRLAQERGSLDIRRVDDMSADIAGLGDYASVIVLHDGGAGTLKRLQLALALRERHRHVRIAVLTYVDDRRCDACPRLAELGPELRIEGEVLSLEYQID